ncbi:hypothetical protein TraAM80_02374 [Trypanosoma rangeli]|uniref:Uncharacterized protein n=1 Tax=Trypanosoma rangeli TaxID=5698 RepID=A0A422NU22_TRYRA|nr:uncharacterized protein TraAM80_02374 [Trypanosoma rangeli]RNF08966.1 hypothetical protein TraAM80_02374 [Trypanosoma rangeli]|eukprot:RNF08966.1 hypothetical protein TraAM80_02374 [Trypanosoma rangeli]
MNPATQDAIETLRQLQKLSRELQPVKTALAALVKREQTNPNPLAAAGSLDKIASRVLNVFRKYSAFFDRASLLLEHELPRLQCMTPLLGIKEEDEKRSTSNVPKKDDDVAHDAFRYVCSPTMPHILNRANYYIVCRMLRLRMEMVDYLIATDRHQLARHVADAYGLPLFWFPTLISLLLPPLPPIHGGSISGANTNDSANVNNNLYDNQGRKLQSLHTFTFLTASPSHSQQEEQGAASTTVAPEHIAIQCIEARHSVTEAIAYCEERLLPAAERIDDKRRQKVLAMLHDLLVELHATRLLQIFRDGTTPEQAVLQYIVAHLVPHASRRSAFVQAIISAATPQNEPYSSSGINAEKPSTSGCEERCAAMSKAKSLLSKKNEESARLVACMMSVEGYHKLAVSFHKVAILLGSQLLSVSEALGRFQGKEGGSDETGRDWTHPLPDLVTRVVATAIFLKDEYFDRMVLERRAAVSPLDPPILKTHLNTQSGSVAFDQSMMTLVEETLRSTLISVRGNEDTGTVPLTAQELLEAEERWSNDVLFIKRPTRFYCYLTKECLDGGTGGNYPIALPNGTVLSKLAVIQCCMKKNSEGDRSQNFVVCPRTKEEFYFSSLRRIFVT